MFFLLQRASAESGTTDCSSGKLLNNLSCRSRRRIRLGATSSLTSEGDEVSGSRKEISTDDPLGVTDCTEQGAGVSFAGDGSSCINGRDLAGAGV